MGKIKKILGIVLAVALVLAMMPAVNKTSAASPDYDQNELNRLRDFLKQDAGGGKSNGQLLNPSFNPEDLSTWVNNGITWSNEETMHVTQIDWNNKGLVGGLDVGQFSGLKQLFLTRNGLTSINISGDTALTELFCDFNDITSIVMEGVHNLQYLICSENELERLDVGDLTELSELRCIGNKLTALDVSRNAKLYTLDCSHNSLTSLNVKGADKLTYLYCNNNNLTSLDLSGTSQLDFLDCSVNSLTGLDVSTCTTMYDLNCSDNKLTSLNLTGTKALYGLNCAGNLLTSLDTSANSNHTYIDCSNNLLSSLTIGRFSELMGMDCRYNRLRSISFSYYGSTLDLDSQGDGYVGFSIYSGDGDFWTQIVAEPNLTTGAKFLKWGGGEADYTNPTRNFVFAYGHDYEYTAYFTGEGGGEDPGEVTQYKVEFKPEGGTWIGGGNLIQSVPEGEDAIEPVVSRKDFTFVGWEGTYKEVTSDQTVYAQWSPNPTGYPGEDTPTPTRIPIIFFTVDFDPNGGTVTGGGLLSQQIQKGGYAIPPIVEMEGYQFVGWDGSIENVSQNVSVKAIWEKLTHQVTFDRNGGIRKGGGQVIQSVLHGEAAVAPELRRYGYTFDGWDKTFDNITEDITVTAKWIKNEEPVVGEKFTVTYDVNGGDGEPPIDITEYAKGDSASLFDGTGISMEGYEFAGWSYEPDGEAIADPEIVIEDNVTLYAVWVEVEAEPTAEPTAVPVDDTEDIPKTGVASGAYFGLAMLAFGGGVVIFEAVRKRRMKKA